MKIAASALLVSLLLLPAAALADTSLQINPLKYQDNLIDTAVRQGFVEVSNPSDTSVRVLTDVKGFQQADLDGNLRFFDDPAAKVGIIPDLPSFVLGPHEAIRVSFSVNPAKLPRGGVYAVIFFRTQPDAGKNGATYLVESANVGTLLLLQNGPPGKTIGQIDNIQLPFFQFGDGISATVTYKNTNRDTSASAVTPPILSRIGWGHEEKITGPLVLPLASRRFSLHRTGSYFGILPVTVSAEGSGKHISHWILACTGMYSYAVLLIGVSLGIILCTGMVRSLRKRSQQKQK